MKKFLLACLALSCSAFAEDDLELNSRIDVVQDTQIFQNEGFNVWGGSTIKADGKYHMFYSRWPGGFFGWMTKSEIAYAVSDSPYGPYKYVKTVLKGSGDESRWDYNNAHNPHIKKFGDHFYLYYIAARPWKGKVNSKGKPRKPTDFQSIGVIKFNSMQDVIDGKLQIPDEPCITANNVETFNRNVNPSVTEGPDGRYYAAMKCRGNDDGGGGFIHWILVAPTPQGPFKVHSKMLDHSLGAEDPYMWYDKKRERFYAIVKEFGSKKLAPQHGALALITSVDAKDWAPAKNPIVTLKSMTRPDGKSYPVRYTDRPQVVFDENGEIIALNTASKNLPGTERTYNVQLRILPKDQAKNLQDEAIKTLLKEVKIARAKKAEKEAAKALKKKKKAEEAKN